MNLEVEVDGRELGVARLPHEPEHVAGLDLAPVHGERRVGGEVGVVELVSGMVAEPEPPAADVVPADREHRPVGDGEQRRPERGEDVLTVMPAALDVGAGCPERVSERHGAEGRKDVAARS